MRQALTMRGKVRPVASLQVGGAIAGQVFSREPDQTGVLGGPDETKIKVCAPVTIIPGQNRTPGQMRERCM